MSTFKGSLRAGAAAFTLAIGAVSISSPALAQSSISLPPASLEDSLNALSRQSGAQILVDQTLLRGKNTPVIRGASSVEAALAQLLHGSGLTWKKSGDAFLIIRDSSGSLPAAAVVSERRPAPAATWTEPTYAIADEGEALVVTGSRIARPELESAMPISITSADDMTALGSISATQMLSLEPALGIGQSLNSGPGINGGIQGLNLRNLGTNRSLTLIDGQRRVSSSGLSNIVDIGMIPVGMIERIEIVTGGAAAIYGADAVSGAANIITRKNITGFHITGTTGISEHGDARESLISFTTGAKFLEDRLHVSLGGTWTQSDPLIFTQRYTDRLYYEPNPENTGPNDGIPDHYLLPDITQLNTSYYPTSWIPTLNNRYVYRDGVWRVGRYDTTVMAPSEFDLGGSGDGSTTYDTMLFRGKNNSKSLMGNYSFEVTPAITLTGNVSWSRQSYEGSGVAGGGYWRDDARGFFLQLTTPGAPEVGGTVVTTENPYLPAAVAEFMAANDLSSIVIGRRYGNWPRNYSWHERETFNFGQSLDGKLTDRLNFGLFFQYGRALDNEKQGPMPYHDHWIAARDVISVDGVPVCRDVAARAQGCVPINVFDYTNAPSQAAIDYAMGKAHHRTVNTQMVFGGGVSGTAVRLPYGDLSVAVGVEHRVEKLDRRDDPLALTQFVYGGGLGIYPDINATQRVTEGYIEAVAPLLRDVTLFKRLELEAAYRHSDYNTIGSTDAWKVGGIWEPVSGLTFRAMRSRSVRAPHFNELYAPQTTLLSSTPSDPCLVGSYYANANRSKNCAALGIAAPGLPAFSTDYSIVTGGNVDLAPETSNSLTLGVIFQPKFLPGFDLTVDYYDISINDAIQQLGSNTVFNLCVDLDSINNPYCALVERDGSTHRIYNVISTNTNTAQLYTRGIDFGANYRRRIGEGQLRMSFKGNLLLDLVTQTTPGQPRGDVRMHGSFTHPQFRASLLTAYSIGKFDISLATRFLGASTYSLSQIENPEIYPNGNRVPAVVYNDLALGLNINEKYRMNFGIKNITNTMPPQYPATFVATTMYDLVGRYFYVTAKTSF